MDAPNVAVPAHHGLRLVRCTTCRTVFTYATSQPPWCPACRTAPARNVLVPVVDEPVSPFPSYALTPDTDATAT
jgi:hypothetical protein